MLDEHKDKRFDYRFMLSFVGMGNTYGNNSPIDTDEVNLCISDEYNIKHSKTVLTELNNPNIRLLDENPELDCSEKMISGVPMWLHIQEKYNNHILIDVTTLGFYGAYDMNADIESMKRYPCVHFILMNTEDTDRVVAELREELSKKLRNIDLNKFVSTHTPTEDYRTDKRTRIYVYQYQSASANHPQFHLSGHPNKY